MSLSLETFIFNDFMHILCLVSVNIQMNDLSGNIKNLKKLHF